MNAAKGKLLNEFLSQVPFYGWSEDALTEAAKNLNLEPFQEDVLFPKSLAGLASFYAEQLNEAMEKAFETNKPSRIRDKITALVIFRLEAMQMHKEAMRRLNQYYALHPKMAANNAWKAVDKMWQLAGDEAADINYYTKRTLLFGVYSATLLYWMNDDSEQFLQTRAFLDRRISNIMGISKVKAKLASLVPNL